MADPASKRATYDDLCALPPNLVGEIVDGVLHAQPRPAPRHARAYTRLTGRIAGAFDGDGDGPGGWTIIAGPELHLATGDIVVPDLAGWRLERMPALPETAWFETVPDWICEILSPGTVTFDRRRKMPLYAKVGVAHAWLVDPDVRSLEVFRLENGRWSWLSTHEGDEHVRAEPFDAVELALGALWSPPAPAK